MIFLNVHKNKKNILKIFKNIKIGIDMINTVKNTSNALSRTFRKCIFRNLIKIQEINFFFISI